MDADLPVGSRDNPFAPSATPSGTPPAVAAVPPDGGGGAASTGPVEPKWVPESEYNRLKAQVDSMAPLAQFAPLLSNPDVVARLTAAFVGAPQVTNAPAVPQADPRVAIRDAYKQRIDAALANGDASGAMALAAEQGEAMATARFEAELPGRAAPLLNATATNVIEGFYAQKRASEPQLFAAVESRLRAFVAQTPPAAMANLIQGNGLTAALETAYYQEVGKTYASAYGKAVTSGAIPGARPTPPNYGSTSNGPPGGLPRFDGADDADAADDAAFNKFAAERGISFKSGPNGAIIGELK